MDTVPAGLQAAPPGDGPVVQFDLTARPLPNIPTPNDIATFPDPTSRTGRRINVSLIAPTDLEDDARERASPRWRSGNVSAPSPVAFHARSPGIAPTDAAIDIENVRARMQRDGYDDHNDDPV